MIIADTSPLNYLILIDAVYILPKMFSEVVIPPAVRHELLSEGAYDVVRRWIENPPEWLTVKMPVIVDETINLGKGETEAISLALETTSEIIALDDRAARISRKQKD
jgi:predicted nucleic acid-binding protein